MKSIDPLLIDLLILLKWAHSNAIFQVLSPLELSPGVIVLAPGMFLLRDEVNSISSYFDLCSLMQGQYFKWRAVAGCKVMM